MISAEDLVPGEIVSVARKTTADDIVPCDCVLLRGSAIVNESTLTGMPGSFIPLFYPCKFLFLHVHKLHRREHPAAQGERPY